MHLQTWKNAHSGIKKFVTSYYSYARPAQPGPNRTRLCCPCIAAIAGDQVRFGPIRLLNLFRYFSVKVLPSWLRNADQWKPDYRVVTNEKPRNYEFLGVDQQLDVSSKVIELDCL